MGKRKLGLPNAKMITKFLESQRKVLKKKIKKNSGKNSTNEALIKTVKKKTSHQQSTVAVENKTSEQHIESCEGLSYFTQMKSGCGVTCLKLFGEYDFECSICSLLYHKSCLKHRPYLKFNDQTTCPNCDFS